MICVLCAAQNVILAGVSWMMEPFKCSDVGPGAEMEPLSRTDGTFERGQEKRGEVLSLLARSLPSRLAEYTVLCSVGCVRAIKTGSRHVLPYLFCILLREALPDDG